MKFVSKTKIDILVHFQQQFKIFNFKELSSFSQFMHFFSKTVRNAFLAGYLNFWCLQNNNYNNNKNIVMF